MHTRRSHFALPRLGLRGQVYLWGLLVLGILLVVSSASAWVLVNQQATGAINTQIEDVLNSFQAEFTDNTDALVLFGKWLANEDALSVSRSLTNPEADKTMETLMGMQYLDFIIVTDSQGRVIAQTGSPDIGNASNDLSTDPDIKQALSGQMSLRTEMGPSGQLAVKFTLPRYGHSSAKGGEETSGSAVGAIRLGYYVDDVYLSSLAKHSPFDMGFIVISKDKLAASKLTLHGASPQMTQFDTGNLDLGDQVLNDGQLVTLKTDRGPYLYKFKPLTAPSHSGSFLIGSGVPVSVLENVHAQWFKTFGLWFLAGLADIAVVGFLMARNLSQPLRQMSAAAERIGNGDLTGKVLVHRGDELGDLGLRLEGMRQALDERIKLLAFEKDSATAAIGAMAVPVVMTDSQDRIVGVNRAAEAVLGESCANLVGRPWRSLFALRSGKNPNGLLTAPHGNGQSNENHAVVSRGQLVLDPMWQPVFDISSEPVHVEGELVGYVHTLQDVSEMDRFGKAKNEFLLSVGHELEGPLASWRASVELLLEDYDEMTRAELGMMLRSLQKTAVRFQGLVGALVDIGKLEAGKFRVRPTSTTFEKLVEDSIGHIEPSLAKRGQQLQVVTGTRPGTRVMADRARISQVIINLLRNASKYSPEGEPITVETREENGQVFFQVTDRGEGIDPEEQEHIFERYYRSKRVEEEGAGIGLGLSLAKAIIEAHEGEIGVTSELGKGSTFWFSLAMSGEYSRTGPEGVHEGISSGR